jgi:hypothetical protein
MARNEMHSCEIEDSTATERHRPGRKIFLVTLAERPHPFPSRTRKLSSPAPKILRGQPFGNIGRRQDFCVFRAPACRPWASPRRSRARLRRRYPWHDDRADRARRAAPAIGAERDGARRDRLILVAERRSTRGRRPGANCRPAGAGLVSDERRRGGRRAPDTGVARPTPVRAHHAGRCGSRPRELRVAIARRPPPAWPDRARRADGCRPRGDPPGPGRSTRDAGPRQQRIAEPARLAESLPTPDGARHAGALDQSRPEREHAGE